MEKAVKAMGNVVKVAVKAIMTIKAVKAFKDMVQTLKAMVQTVKA